MSSALPPIIVVGPGAVGGGLGGALHAAGHAVTFVGRGAHAAALQRDGLLLSTPRETKRLRVPTFLSLQAVPWRGAELVLLAVKSQDSASALGELAAVAPRAMVVCAQNGVANERLAAAGPFAAVYGAMVFVPASHERPGEVSLWSAEGLGLLDIGCYPSGCDAIARDLATSLTVAGFDARACPDVMQWKGAKLLSNLGNAVQALCGSHVDCTALLAGLAAEADACYRASGADPDRLRSLLTKRLHSWSGLAPINGRTRAGGSSWQSLARGSGSIEARFLNGEISAMGRRHTVPTPLNDALVGLAEVAATGRQAPGGLDPATVFELATNPSTLVP